MCSFCSPDKRLRGEQQERGASPGPAGGKQMDRRQLAFP